MSKGTGGGLTALLSSDHGSDDGRRFEQVKISLKTQCRFKPFRIIFLPLNINRK